MAKQASGLLIQGGLVPREPHQSLLMPMKMRHPSLRVHAGLGMVQSAPELYGPSEIFFATVYCVCVGSL